MIRLKLGLGHLSFLQDVVNIQQSKALTDRSVLVPSATPSHHIAEIPGKKPLSKVSLEQIWRPFTDKVLDREEITLDDGLQEGFCIRVLIPTHVCRCLIIVFGKLRFSCRYTV